jgi:hypothetical protein
MGHKYEDINYIKSLLTSLCQREVCLPSIKKGLRGCVPLFDNNKPGARGDFSIMTHYLYTP